LAKVAIALSIPLKKKSQNQKKTSSQKLKPSRSQKKHLHLWLLNRLHLHLCQQFQHPLHYQQFPNQLKAVVGLEVKRLPVPLFAGVHAKQESIYHQFAVADQRVEFDTLTLTHSSLLEAWYKEQLQSLTLPEEVMLRKLR
jgi:hypothetical protein